MGVWRILEPVGRAHRSDELDMGGRDRVSQDEPQVSGLGKWKDKLSLQID